MEDNTSVMMSRRKTTTLQDDKTPEESSWTMYFQDFFSEGSKIQTTDDDDDGRHDDISSVISDAASFVGMKKINVRHEEPSSSRKRRSRQVSIASHDLEDTASSPSRHPDVYSMMNLLDNNTRHDGVGGDAINEKGKVLRQDGVGISIDLKKKGFCLVPSSMVANYIG